MRYSRMLALLKDCDLAALLVLKLHLILDSQSGTFHAGPGSVQSNP